MRLPMTLCWPQEQVPCGQPQGSTARASGPSSPLQVPGIRRLHLPRSRARCTPRRRCGLRSAVARLLAVQRKRSTAGLPGSMGRLRGSRRVTAGRNLCHGVYSPVVLSHEHGRRLSPWPANLKKTVARDTRSSRGSRGHKRAPPDLRHGGALIDGVTVAKGPAARQVAPDFSWD